MFRIIGLLILLLCSPGMVLAQGDAYKQQFENGQVNWENGMVTAIGLGAPPASVVNMAQARAMARRAAIIVGRRNLLEIIKGVQIDSETKVENYMVSSDVIVSQVRGFLQNSQILDTAYMSDGSVEVTVGLSLHGAMSSVLLPKNLPFKSIIPGAPTPPPASPKPVIVPSAPAGEVFTGLLVDATGLGVVPAMSPKILDEDGQEVYGSAVVGREYAMQQGMAGYAGNKEQAVQNTRVADKPFIVKALHASGKGQSDIVVSREDGAAIRGLAQQQNFLEKCRVMIVLN